MQTLATVLLAKQIERIGMLPDGSVEGLIVSNRTNLEDFSVDLSGRQALDIMDSDEIKQYRDKNPNVAILADVCIGIVIVTGNATGGSPEEYIKQLRERNVG